MMELLMEKEDIGKLYQWFIDESKFTVDMTPYWGCTTPFVLAGHDFECSDKNKVKLYLISDRGPDNNEEIYFQVDGGNKSFRYLLCENNDYSDFNSYFSIFTTEAVQKRAIKFLFDLWKGGKEFVDIHILNTGFLGCDTMLITAQRMDSVVKLPSSCSLGIWGEVFHGVKDLESYCCSQMEDSSPYLLKRSVIVRDDECRIDRKYINYLICRDKSEAIRYTKTFIGIEFLSAQSLDYDADNDNVPDPKRVFISPRDFPPMVCTASDLRYLLLAYIKGKD